mgnify:CR=1 FL=1
MGRSNYDYPGYERGGAGYWSRTTLLYGSVTFGALLWSLPFWWMLSTALTANPTGGSVSLIPSNPTFANFEELFATQPVGRWFFNTIVFAGSVTAFNLVFDSLAGYALAKIEFVGREKLFLLFVATVMGISFGLFSAFRQHSFSDRIVTAVAYLGLGIPNFWLATVLFSAAVARHQFIAFPELPITSSALYSFDFTLLYGFIPWLDPNTTQGFFVLPIITLTTALLAGQLRYTRSESLEYIDMEFVKIARAKGAGPFRVARHVLRNAAIPLLSLFLTEMLSVLVLGVLVIEEVFNIPGFGSLMLRAVGARDMPLILGVTMVVAFIGIVGNFLQDVAYTVLDPRVGSDTD